MTLPIRIFLFFAAMVLVGIGTTLAFAPHLIYSGIEGGMPASVMLISDIRSAGVLLLTLGVCVFAAGLRMVPTRFALVVLAIAALSYGIGRFVSFALDGVPGPSIYFIAGIEWALGILALGALFSLRTSGSKT